MPATRSVPWFRVVLFFLLLYFLAMGVAKPLLRPYAYSDFVTYYHAARVFAARASPYVHERLQSQEIPEYSGWVGRYLYPPPFAAVFVRPLSHLPFPLARSLWLWLECAAYLLAGLVLTQVCFGTLRRGAWEMTALLFLPFAPFHYDLKIGSVSGQLLLLCALFLLARSRRRDGLAAFALAAAILLKLTPALLLLVLFTRGELRLGLRTLGAVCVLILLCSPMTGWSVYGEYVLQVLPGLARDNYSWFSNQSLDAFFWRLFVPNPDTTPWVVSPLLHVLLTTGTSLLVLGFLLRVTWIERRRAAGTDVAPSLALVAASVLARVSWESMVVLSLPCFLAAFHALQQGRLRRWEATVLAVAFALCALPLPYAQHPLRSGAGLLLMAPRLAGMLLAFTVMAREIPRAVEDEGISAAEPVVS